jgi:hypothetical protein
VSGSTYRAWTAKILSLDIYIFWGFSLEISGNQQFGVQIKQSDFINTILSGEQCQMSKKCRSVCICVYLMGNYGMTQLKLVE